MNKPEISSMAYPAQAIANYFIKKSLEEGRFDMTVMKVSKLIYIAHGWSLALNDQHLIGEPIQAWKFGPVIESIYQELNFYGRDPISSLIIKVEPDAENPYEIDANDQETKKLLDRVWDVYKKYSGWELSEWSHQKDGPWYQAWHKDGGSKNRYHVIPNEIIKDYFSKLINSHANG